MLDILSDVLSRLAIQGTLYFRTSFSSPWGVEVPPFENVARFHYAARGECLVRVSGANDTVSLAQGDLVIIPHGAGHSLFCAQTPDDAILHLDRVIEESGYEGDGVLVYGGDPSVDPADDRPTQLICGHISFAPDARHAIFERLPPYIHIRDYGASSASWMEATLRAIGEEAGQARMGADLIALKMSEVIFAQAIRTFIESQDAEGVGLSGFADPYISRALAAFHADPAAAWTVERLAREAGLSRTGFAQRFVQKMGLTPMQYLTGWRVQLARDALADGQLSTLDVAERAGYASEAAFARVFKKDVGMTPAAYRVARAQVGAAR